MKKIYLLIFCVTVFSAMQLGAQSSDRISYQAVVRAGGGNAPVVNQSCGVRISILQGGESGSAVYVEKHAAATNAGGLLTLAIGDGAVQSGSFAAIDWAKGPYFVKTEIDPAGGTNYSLTSTTQLLTVPYALHAQSAATISGSIPAEKITGLPAGFGGDYNDLTGKPNIKDSIATHGFSGDYDDLTNKPTNVGSFNNDKGYAIHSEIQENLAPVGENVGDMLYWNGSGRGWSVLSIGQNGQILTIKNGKPTWIDATANTYKTGDIYLENGIPKGIIANIDGMTGILISFDEYNKTWGPDTLIVCNNASGYQNTIKARQASDSNASTYPAFAACIALGADEWYLPSREELNKVYENRNFVNTCLNTLGRTQLSGAYWTSSEQEKTKAAVLQFTTVGTNFAGTERSELKSSTFAVRAMRKLTSIELNSRPEDYHLYAVGDIYYDENNTPIGVVYEVSDMGIHGKIIDLREKNFPWYENDGTSPVSFCGATNETDGMLNRTTVENCNVENADYRKEYTALFFDGEWYAPAKNEWNDIYAKKDIINSTLSSLSQGDVYRVLLHLDGSYWSSTEIDIDNAYSFSFATGSATSLTKDTSCYTRAIRKF